MNKSMIAVFVALAITTCVGLGILAVGGAAFFNKNGVTPSNSPSQAVNASSATTQNDQIAQLQSLVSQYQQRDQQLQSQLQHANAQIQSDQQTVQEARDLLAALQQRGLIRITNDGQIFITQ
ncbi:MAG TPA: hypothetical protein VK909_13865 [Anaerolineales bacterium]|nr:hypothetical protein [Anaerolineales bacterium]